MDRLKDKVVIITGVCSGIGLAAAILFAKEGAKVVGACRNTSGKGDETIRMIRETGGEVIYIQADVSKAGDVRKMIKTAVDTYGRLDILFNNAGIFRANSITDCTEEVWEEVISNNLKSVWLCMKYGIPEMLKTGGGVVVNTASMAADRGIANAAA